MFTFLHNKFLVNLNHITKYNRILIAISGGQDSTCLLKLIYDCHYNKRQLEVLYIDYQWKTDSFKHTKHIINLITQLLIPISIYQVKKAYKSEKTARQLRYKLLIQHARNNQFDTIITGHNLNDKIETSLQNLIRGSGLNGITSFTITKKITQKISIVRPLINFTKPEITWFCRHLCLPIWSDITNWNYKIKRNRIRYEFMPYLKNHFNPQINHAINRFTNLCQEDNEYIKQNTIKLYLKSRSSRYICLNINLINEQHTCLQKRVLQLYFYYHFYQKIPLTQISHLYNQKYQTINFNHLIITYTQGWLYAYRKA